MTTKATILRAIRGACLDCSCGQPGEVRKCAVRTCPLWPFRMGLDPDPSQTRGFGKSAVYTDDFETADRSGHERAHSADRALAGT